jgi:hypothetical protein
VTPREPGKRTRPWFARDTRRKTTAERGYDGQWEVASTNYRKLNPLCVPCLLVQRVRAVGCVDHIVPIHSCPELRMEVTNWASMCARCHGRKTRTEPQGRWEPRYDRIVVCGLPGTGKTTWARASGLPYWDADEHEELVTIEQLVARRDEWMSQQSGACVVIVASPMTASVLASRLFGVVKHMTERYIERAPHPLWHVA